MSAHGGRTHVSEESEGLVRAAFSAPRTRASGFSVVRRHHASPLDSLKRRSVNLRLRATTEAGAAKSRLAAACRRRAWCLATTSSCGAIPSPATLRVFRATGRGSPLRGTRNDAEVRLPSNARFPVFFHVGLRANSALTCRRTRKSGFPSPSPFRVIPCRPQGRFRVRAGRKPKAHRGETARTEALASRSCDAPPR